MTSIAGAADEKPGGERLPISKSATTAKCSANTAKTAPHREEFQALDFLFKGTFFARR
jgi:hypothetical protein